MTRIDQPATWPAPESPADALARQILGLAAVRRELTKAAQREVASHGFGALIAIRKRGTARVSEIAVDLQVDISVASRQITALVDAGHVERRADPTDRRAQVLQVTEEGRTAIRRAYRQMVAALDATLSDWAPDEITALAHALERLATSFAPPGSPAATSEHDQEVVA